MITIIYKVETIE